MRGTVYKSTGSWYLVKDDSGKFRDARIKGVFKIDGITSTNPLAVGDEVDFEIENDQDAVVTVIRERKNYISRQSPRARNQHHIVASNLDQALMFATLKEPRTSQGFIDRFLVACEMYHVPAVIVFNKADVYREKELQRYDELYSMYSAIGYHVYLMSVHKKTGVEQVKEKLKAKTSLLSGHSGVGKSSFINEILPSVQLKTKDVSGWSGKGLHTTTFAEMFDLPFTGKIIDTPGMREFGLVDVERQELSGYFPEMRDRLNNCQFNNCLHTSEPGCAIKEAVSNGEIHEDRYVSYVHILESLPANGWQ